jgi:signal transduction histidine kinase
MKFAAALALVLLGSLAASAQQSEPQEPPPGVLILYSNQRPLPAQVVIEDSLRTTLTAGYKQPLSGYSESLDDEWGSLEAYGARQAEFLREKYQRRNIRVLVVVSLPALRFALRYRDTILAGIPVVHMTVSQDRVDPTTLPAGVVGNSEDNDPYPTLELALKLHPGTKHLILIRGASEIDRRWDERMRAAVARLGSGVTADFLSALPTRELLAKVGALERGTIVFTPGYFNDGAGEVTTPRQSIERIAAAANVPDYGAFDTQVGTGNVGGFMTPYEQQAKEAGAIVVRLLQGTNPADIAPSLVKRLPVVDWRQVRRWGVDERALPADTIVRFREPPVWEKYAEELAIAMAVVLLQAVLITGLLIQRARRRRAELASSMLAGRLMTAHEDERRRLARDLHDDVTQRLARLAIDAGLLERDREGRSAIARSVREELVRLSEDVHKLSYQLHPSVLDDLGLAEGLRAECDRMSRQASIAVSVDAANVPARVPRETSLCLFRVAQEALRNAVRHAKAKAIAVSLRRKGRGLELVVRDDGQGFDTEAIERSPSLGQVSMRERVRLVAGRLDVESALGQGTKVTAWVPLEDGLQ